VAWIDAERQQDWRPRQQWLGQREPEQGGNAQPGQIPAHGRVEEEARHRRSKVHDKHRRQVVQLCRSHMPTTPENDDVGGHGVLHGSVQGARICVAVRRPPAISEEESWASSRVQLWRSEWAGGELGSAQGNSTAMEHGRLGVSGEDEVPAAQTNPRERERSRNGARVYVRAGGSHERERKGAPGRATKARRQAGDDDARC
jgi:hypothetical protein